MTFRLYAPTPREPLLRFDLPGPEKYISPPPFSGGILVQGALGHDRLGDLYFMKGQQSIRTMKMSELVESIKGENSTGGQPENTKRTGYLQRAQYNYAMSLWTLRKYLTNRHRISGSAWTTIDDIDDVFERGSITSSQFHTTLVDALTDLAEVIYARRSSLRCSSELVRPSLNNDRSHQYENDIALSDVREYRRYIRRTFNQAVDLLNKELIALADDGSSNQRSAESSPWLEDDAGKNILAEARKDEFPARAYRKVDEEFRTYLEDAFPDLGPLSHWIGDWRNVDPDHDAAGQQRPQAPYGKKLKITAPKNELEQIYAYKFFGQASARASQAIGQSTNTSNEYFLHADALNRVLWSAKTFEYLNSDKIGGDEGNFGDRAKFFVEKTNTEADSARSDKVRFHIGLLSMTSILDAIQRIQLSDRPSVTRMALNHGNPKHTDGIMATKSNVDQSELQADYDLAQAFRDEPRGISLACSLVLALLEEDSGPLCTSLALLVYNEVLVTYARETFIPPEDDDDEPAKLLRRALQRGYFPNRQCGATGQLSEGVKNYRHKLRQSIFQATYAGLAITLERYRFPILNRLNGLKVLADALLLQPLETPKKPEDEWPETRHLFGREAFYAKYGTSKNSQIARLVREMTMASSVYGSEIHFPTERSGSTMALTFLHMQHYGLHAIYDDNISDPPRTYNSTSLEDSVNEDEAERAKFYRDDDLSKANLKRRPLLNETVLTRESVGEFALNRLNRSQESFSMGDAYYENIDYLNYLNDDFNDRSIHFFHATSMAQADFTEVLGLLVKEGFSARSRDT